MAEARDSMLSATKAGCALALLLFARVATAQNGPGAAEPPASEKTPAAPPSISYAGGQLRINALDSTLADVLTKVAALTGMKIEVPDGANRERMPMVELGPGPARQVLASLLSDSTFDYLIQASDADPEKIQSVLLMPREKKGSGANATTAAARPARGPNGRPAPEPAQPEEAPAPDSAVAATPESAAAEAMSLSSQPDPSTQAPPAPLDPSGQFPRLQPDSSNPAKPGALTPPQVLNPESINQQLQQMYQQRTLMTQQDHFTGTQPVPAIPGTK